MRLTRLLQQSVDRGGERRLRLCTDHAVDGLAIAEEYQGGDGTGIESTRALRIVVDVHLDDLDTSGVARGQLLQHRGDHATRPAPGRPEVDEYQLACVGDGREVGVGRVGDPGQRLLARSTLGPTG